MKITRFADFGNSQYLYHYTKSNTATEFILPNMTLRFSRLSNVGDPYENKELRIGERYMPKLKDFKPPKYFLDIDITRFDKVLDDCLKFYCRVGCFCFGDEGYHKPRMWDHYGDGYKGICLILSKKDMLEAVRKTHQTIFEGGIKYCDFNHEYHYDIIDYNTRKNFMKRMSKDDQVDLALIYLKNRLLFKKELDYKDEAEYRIVAIDKSEDELFVDISRALKAVVHGTLTDKNQRNKIRALCSKNSIPLFEQLIHNRQTYYESLT